VSISSTIDSLKTRTHPRIEASVVSPALVASLPRLQLEAWLVAAAKLRRIVVEWSIAGRNRGSIAECIPAAMASSGAQLRAWCLRQPGCVQGCGSGLLSILPSHSCNPRRADAASVWDAAAGSRERTRPWAAAVGVALRVRPLPSSPACGEGVRRRPTSMRRSACCDAVMSGCGSSIG
jgi:hypothetical protein